MKSPLDLVSRCLSDIEDRWIPYSSLWWRLWTPPIPRGERRQAGAFTGYGDPNEDNDDPDNPITTHDLALHDIRRILSVPFLRHIYKRSPYIDVVPRILFITESTLHVYNAGKALYPRHIIASLEAQLTAAGAKLARRSNPRKHHHLRRALFSHCEAPQTAFLSYPAYDGVTQHVGTWAPGTALTLSDSETVFRPGRSQVEFRTIQELTQPDPENGEAEFVPDSWTPCVGYTPVVELADGSVRAKRAMALLAVVQCLRELAQGLDSQRGRSTIPIYMPAYDINRKWTPTEEIFLRKLGVVFVPSNGELFLKVDERTAVVSYRNWNPVKQVVADLAKPAVLICQAVNGDPGQDFRYKEEEREGEDPVTVPVIRSRMMDSSIIKMDPDSPRVRELVKDYDKLELPELPGRVAKDEEDEVLCLYLRKANASTIVEYW
ncbi:hypothetical protein N0V88_006774 [Collariella sp. IMI 366227]|nr:hypothetical protein N0V88_006774 [Collariella sp. IMI 366227]